MAEPPGTKSGDYDFSLLYCQEPETYFVKSLVVRDGQLETPHSLTRHIRCTAKAPAASIYIVRRCLLLDMPRRRNDEGCGSA